MPSYEIPLEHRSQPDASGSPSWLSDQFFKSGLPESYRQRWMSNPYWDTYRKLNNDYNSGIIPTIMGVLGVRSSSERDAANARQNALAYQNDLISEYAQNQYNSPLESAARERAAGLNPSLAGLDAANSDVGNPEPAFGSEIGASEPSLGEALSFGNPFLQMAQVSLSLASGFKQLKNLQLDNDLKNIAKYESIGTLADSAAAASITPATFESIAKLSDEEKAGLIAGDSNFDDILEASVQTSSAADEWIKSFPKPTNARERAFLAKARSEFILRRNSVFRQAQSWNDFVSMRKSIADPANQDFLGYSKFAKATLDFEQAKLDIESKKILAESLLWDDATFVELWTKHMSSELRAKISSDVLKDTQNQFDQAVLDSYVNDADIISSASEAEKEAIKSRLQQMIVARLQAELAQTTLSIRQRYFDDYQFMSGPSWSFKYRSSSPAFEVYQEAKGEDYHNPVSGAMGDGIDFLLKYLSLGKIK